MTLQERPRFTQAFNRLAVAVRLPADQADAAMKQIFFDGLVDLPIDAVEDAARELANAEWFPKLGEWRSVAEKARNARDIARALPAAREWHVECGTCDDTGWETPTCPGDGSCGLASAEFCKRQGQPHTYAVACACRATNRTYQRRLAEQRERRRTQRSAKDRD